jgi:hypothetical protein
MNAYIPPDAKWYLADLVEQITVEGDPRCVVHINTLLIRADSPEEAHEKAMQLGIDHEQSYENIDDKKVDFVFRGLMDLHVIHEELEHGAEICYSERVGLKEEEIAALVTPKDELAVFAPMEDPSKKPNYASGDIMRKLNEYMESDEE